MDVGIPIATQTKPKDKALQRTLRLSRRQEVQGFMYDETTIGARLRVLRRWRGMTMTQLAHQAGLSQSFLSMAERGQRALDRRSHIAALAAALEVSETELVGGPHLSNDRVQSDPHTRIPALRVALVTNTLSEPMVDRARPLPELVAQVKREVEPLRRSCDYSAVGDRLPDILDELHFHIADPAGEDQYALALQTLIEACIVACLVAKNLGHNDLAHIAAIRATEAADAFDDPIAAGKAAFVRVQSIPKVGTWERAFTAAKRAADALQTHAADGTGAAVLGMLTLNTALAAASLCKNDEADHWLNEATDLARRVPDDPVGNWQSFSATNVGVWRVTVGVETGQSGRAILGLAGGIEEDKLSSQSYRRATYLADVGRGLAHDPKTRDAAVNWLQRAEKIAPQHVRNSAHVREAVAVMLQQAKASAGGRELRGIAARMGVPH
jgi:transcriptional regulator with XRE-family HTH domain